MTAKPTCKHCGTSLVKLLNIDKRERGGGRFLWICPNISNVERVRDTFDYSHLEIYCVYVSSMSTAQKYELTKEEGGEPLIPSSTG